MTKKQQASLMEAWCSVCQSYLCFFWSLYFTTLIASAENRGIPHFHFRLSAFTLWFSGHLKDMRRKDSP